MVSTGALACDSEYLAGSELFVYPRTVLAPGRVRLELSEQCLGHHRRAPTLTPATNYVFNGGYVQVAYTLTGENRAYDKKTGCLSRYYFGTQGPYERGFAVRDENGGWCWGKGAWEVAARYNYIDLNPAQARPGSMAASWMASAWP